MSVHWRKRSTLVTESTTFFDINQLKKQRFLGKVCIFVRDIDHMMFVSRNDLFSVINEYTWNIGAANERKDCANWKKVGIVYFVGNNSKVYGVDLSNPVEGCVGEPFRYYVATEVDVDVDDLEGALLI